MSESKVLAAIAQHINIDLDYIYNLRDICAGEYEYTLVELLTMLDKLAGSGYINQHVPNQNIFTITEKGLSYLNGL